MSTPEQSMEASEICTEYKGPATTQMVQKAQTYQEISIPHRSTQSCKTKCTNGNHDQRIVDSNNSEKRGLTDVIRRRNEITKMLVKQSLKTLLSVLKDNHVLLWIPFLVTIKN